MKAFRINFINNSQQQYTVSELSEEEQLDLGWDVGLVIGSGHDPGPLGKKKAEPKPELDLKTKNLISKSLT